MDKRVLIVDDDLSILDLLETYLTDRGYQVLRAENGLQALDVVRSQRPRMIIADWTMPGMHGLELCRAIRADKSLGFIYYILLTAHSEKSRVIEALNDGADAYITKPFNEDELLARLHAGERIVDLEAELAQRLQVESERNRLKEAIAAMDQVLGVVGHEMRTPLAGLRTTAEFLLSPESKEIGEIDTFLMAMHTEIVRMVDMVNNLLEAARLNSGFARWNWSTVSLERVANDAVDTIRPLVDFKKVTVTCDVAPPSLAMSGDADAIRRLIVNLVTNAHRNTQAGTISVHVAQAQQPDCVQIEVEDTGGGIPPALAARIGEAFALNSGSLGAAHVKGSGLGLAICKGIAAAHGGKISIQSQQGKGTRVTVLLRTDLTGAITGSQNVEIVRNIQPATPTAQNPVAA